MRYAFLLRRGACWQLLSEAFIFTLLLAAPAAATPVFINEFHYDNAGADSGEGIEIAGPAGTDLDGWSLQLYNGSNGSVYDSVSLDGTIPAQQAGFGTLAFAQAGLQNGAPDGFALVLPDLTVVQFLSYEGVLTASDGAAAGMTSVDAGVAESPAPDTGYSLQLAGTGSLYEDFAWTAPTVSSFGAINQGQSFSSQAPLPAPEPGTLLLFAVGAPLLLLRRQPRD